jgi:hypothetical protein
MAATQDEDKSGMLCRKAGIDDDAHVMATAAVGNRDGSPACSDDLSIAQLPSRPPLGLNTLITMIVGSHYTAERISDVCGD